MTDSSMKVMKIIHESVNKRANGRVHLLTPFLIFFRVFPCLSWLRKGFSLRLANSRVSPATAGCLCARNGPAVTVWFCTAVSKLSKMSVQGVQNRGG